MLDKKIIYFDNNATTHIDNKIALEMYNFMLEGPFNPSSVHFKGRTAKAVLEEVRIKITNSLKVSLKNREYKVIFTSGATEANNLIIKGFDASHIITSPIEHLSVLNSIDDKVNKYIVPVDENGLIILEKLEETLKDASSKSGKILVSIILANNETGVLQDIKAISEICKKYNATLHSDIVQAYGKMPLNMEELGIDIATICSHKNYGPAGVGAIICKYNINFSSIILGGGQEKGTRSGTENVPAIFAFGKVVDNIEVYRAESEKIQSLRDYLEAELIKIEPKIKFYSQKVDKLSNTSVFTMPNVSKEVQVIAFDLEGICISSGTACSSGKMTNSYVLEAMGVDPDEASTAIRVSLGIYNNKEEIDEFIKIWTKIYRKAHNK